MVQRNKKYNPNKKKYSKIPVYAFLPLFGTLDILITLLKRGYLSCSPYKANLQNFPHEYSLLAYLYHHTFIVSELIGPKENKVMKYLINIRQTIENCTSKIMKAAYIEDEDKIILPKQIKFTSLQIGKLIWFIENSKKCFYGVNESTYKSALKNGALNQVIQLQLHPDYYLNYFFDKEGLIESYQTYYGKI